MLGPVGAAVFFRFFSMPTPGSLAVPPPAVSRPLFLMRAGEREGRRGAGGEEQKKKPDSLLS